MVMIEPFASVQAIEDFLWPRVQRSAAEKAREEAAAKAASAAAETADGAPAASAPSSRTSPRLKRFLSKAKSSNASAKRVESVEAMFAEVEDDSDDDMAGDVMPPGAPDDYGMDHDGDPYGDYDEDEDDEEDDAEDLVDDALDTPDSGATPGSHRRSGVVDLSDLGAATPAESMEVDAAAAAPPDVESKARSRSKSAGASELAGPAAAAAAPSRGRAAEPSSTRSGRRIQVFMNGVPLDQTTTIYQAIQQHQRSGPTVGGVAGRHSAYRHLSGRIFTVTYSEFVETPPTSVIPLLEDAVGAVSHHIEDQLVAPPDTEALGPSDPVFMPIMLLRALYHLNEGVVQLFPGNAAYVTHLLHPDEFLNNSLASKLTRQVSDLEKICAGSFPDWCGSLIMTCPFMVPFECKKLFFFYTAFGSVRALVHYQDANSIPDADSSDRALPSRISRIKVHRPLFHIPRLCRFHVAPSSLLNLFMSS